MLRSLLLSALAVAPLPAVGQVALDCFGYQASAIAIPEPWEDYTKTFANGNVRVTLMDAIEPAAGALYLLIQSPPRDELGNRTCALIGGYDDGTGFAGLEWDRFDASYDPARGLIFRVPVTLYAPAAGTGFVATNLAVTVNQATGEITPMIE